MQKNEFLYWLQGFFELRDQKVLLTKRQVDLIAAHLGLVQSSDSYLDWLRRTVAAIQQSNYKDARSMALIETTLPSNFLNVTQENPFTKGYQSLGDIYNTQRLC